MIGWNKKLIILSITISILPIDIPIKYIIIPILAIWWTYWRTPNCTICGNKIISDYFMDCEYGSGLHHVECHDKCKSK